MAVDTTREGSLLEDLQRCRRLVAAMRGQVAAPSRKQQVMKQLLAVVPDHHQRKLTKSWATNALPSPRERYLRDLQAARIRIIQRRWRRYMLQKRILAKARMVQKWKNRQGIPRFRKNSLIIQRTFRGHFVRKHKIDVASYIEGHVSKLDRLRSDREAYHLKCEHVQQELHQIRLDIDGIRNKLSKEEEKVALQANRNTVTADSNVVNEDGTELVKYYKGAVTELEERARHLDKKLHEPVVHVAAALIQALYRGVRCRMERIRKRQHQRQVYARMLQSKDLCFDRMRAARITRNQKLWDASARVIAGLYHIQQAKIQQQELRRDRAARRILRWYREVITRTTAKPSLRWKQVKRQAEDIAETTLMQLAWSGWLRCLQEESQRRKLIAECEIAGVEKWCNAKARCFLSAHRKKVIKRQHLEREIMPQLHDRVLLHIRTATEEELSTESAQDISSAFLLHIRSDIWTWRVPDKQLYALAWRYNLPLDSLPLERINLWLSEEAPSFVDLYAPLPTQTLLALDQFSQYFSLHSRVLLETQRIHEVYEAHMLAREYLALLYAANVVRLSPSTTFSSHQRQRAVTILQENDKVEYLPVVAEGGLELDVKQGLVRRNAFTSFHCLWNHHLCERCLAMRPDRHEASRQCKCCGHHLYEVNTVARDLRLESREVSDILPSIGHSTSPRGMWASTTERCDYMVLHAFLHVLAPVNHENRRTHSLDVLWKLALSSAYESVAELYNRLPTGSLNDLLNASREESETLLKACCPPSVTAQLLLFITTLREEWTQVDAQLSLEAQVAATVFSQQERRSFQKGERPSKTINNPATNSIVKRKKSKRVVQPNGGLKPLVTLARATKQ